MMGAQINNKTNFGLPLKRRDFLFGLGVSITGIPWSLQSWSTPAPLQDALPQRAIYQQMSYFNFDSAGETFTQPSYNHSTKEYINSISHETFLSRHWFT